MPPGAKRGGGGKEAGRAEGGRREERRTREEGLRGRGEGKRAAWEGKGRRSGGAWGRGRGRGPRESAERERKGRRERRIRGVEEDPGVHSFSRSPLPCLPASPSLSSLSGPGAPDAASQLPGWRGRGSNCKTFRKLHRVAGRGLHRPTGRGGGARLTQAARPRPLAPPLSRLFLPTSPAAKRPLPPRLGGPLPRSDGEGAEPRARPPRQRLGEGEAGSLCPVREGKHLQVLF